MSDAFRDVFDPSSDYSVSAHDVPHDLVTNFVWEIPVGRGKALGNGTAKVADAIAGGSAWGRFGLPSFHPVDLLYRCGNVGLVALRAFSQPTLATPVNRPSALKWTVATCCAAYFLFLAWVVLGFIPILSSAADKQPVQSEPPSPIRFRNVAGRGRAAPLCA